MKNKNYILYGVGWEAECFLFQNPNIISQIKYCFDRDKKGKFHGIDIKEFDVACVENNDIIIVAAGTEGTWNSIKNMLLNLGLEEWKNFKWSKTFQKKIVVINANCYGLEIKKYLELSPTFQKNYFIYPVPEVYANTKGEIERSLLEQVDVFIHQDIRKDYFGGEKLSDEYIRSRLSEKCKMDICVPNFVGLAKWMYPQLGELDKFYEFSNGKGTNVFYRDIVLDEAINSCNSLKEYIDYWKNYKYSNEELDRLYNVNIEKLYQREKNWDIKIVNFIEKNYKVVQCFVDHSHPSTLLMSEIGKQIAELLQISDINKGVYNVSVGFHAPLLDCVKQHFGMEMKCELKKMWFGKNVERELEDYIKAYLWCYHDILLS